MRSTASGHARGKCLRDLVRHRRGEIGRIPDAVVRPGDEDAVRAVMSAAVDADASYLVPTWSSGPRRDARDAGEASPSVTRVSDPYETAFSFSTKRGDSLLDRVKSRALRQFLQRRRGYDFGATCLSFIG